MTVYEIDRETREQLEAALNIMAQVAEMQATDEGLVAIYSLANSIADRFGIESRVATVEEVDGKIVVTYAEDSDDEDVPPPGSVH